MESSHPSIKQINEDKLHTPMTTSFFTLGRKNWLCFSTTEMKGLWPWPLPFQKDTHALLGLACTFTVLFIPFPVLEKKTATAMPCLLFCPHTPMAVGCKWKWPHLHYHTPIIIQLFYGRWLLFLGYDGSIGRMNVGHKKLPMGFS